MEENLISSIKGARNWALSVSGGGLVFACSELFEMCAATMVIVLLIALLMVGVALCHIAREIDERRKHEISVWANEYELMKQEHEKSSKSDV